MPQTLKDDKNWTIQFNTQTRDQLIDVSRVIAHAIAPYLSENLENIPHIAVIGSVRGANQW